MKTGTVNLPLHGGRAPRWLFQRMVRLSREIARIIVYEYGTDEFLHRIADPYWFQAFSCVLGFDWHSSGTTTTTCGALKVAIDPEEMGIAVAGGKGRTSRKTPDEIRAISESDAFSLSGNTVDELVYSSRMSAKVDNTCVQDGYQLYHHCFVFTKKGEWAVVQQGMNEQDRYARRYHWLSSDALRFVCEPHLGICCDRVSAEGEVLDMTAEVSEETRKTSLDLVKDDPDHLMRYFRSDASQTTLFEFDAPNRSFSMPHHHPVLGCDIGKQGWKVLRNAYELQPDSYEELLSLVGMGPKKIRALALVSDLIYGTEPSWQDPATYSFAHGGKDGYPYPVDRDTYDQTIEVLRDAIEGAEIGREERYRAIRRLGEFV
ncbi:MAG TPA: DUF763 domain-containing protein [Methanosarcinales archaeon]|nr:DUF763 domain-containing protein [Methanosarcinales archaeon]